MFVNYTHVLTILCVYNCVTKEFKSLATAHKMNAYSIFICSDGQATCKLSCKLLSIKYGLATAEAIPREM